MNGSRVWLISWNPTGAFRPSGKRSWRVATLRDSVEKSYALPDSPPQMVRREPLVKPTLGLDGRPLWAKRRTERPPPPSHWRTARAVSAPNGRTPSGSLWRATAVRGANKPAAVCLPEKSAASKRQATRWRTAQRRDLRQRVANEPWKGYLRRRTVRPLTRERYQRSIHRLLQFAASHGRVLRQPVAGQMSSNELQLLDDVLDDYVVQIYRDGGALQEAREVVCAVAWSAGLRLSAFPTARQCLAGFGKEQPGWSREPVTWPEVVLAAACLLKIYNPLNDDIPFVTQVFAGVASLVQFDTYCRPSELLSMRLCDVVRPRRAEGCFAFIFSPQGEMPLTKTNTFDDTVILGSSCDERMWVNKVFSKYFLCRVRQIGDPASESLLFDLSLTEYERCLRAASAHLLLPTGRMLPHQLRHGGASMDGLSDMDITRIQARGRWSEMKNVRRYKKRGRYLKRLNMLTDAQMMGFSRMQNYIQEGCSSVFTHTFVKRR